MSLEYWSPERMSQEKARHMRSDGDGHGERTPETRGRWELQCVQGCLQGDCRYFLERLKENPASENIHLEAGVFFLTVERAVCGY